MKKILFIAGFLLCTVSCFAQKVTGDWYGNLEVQPGVTLPLVLHVSETNGAYSATLDSPKQGAFGIPVTTTTYENSVLSISLSTMGLQYTGTLKSDALVEGTFTQGPLTMPLTLGREANEGAALKRPQEPKAPFPYTEEEVSFDNTAAGITLAATLTMPNTTAGEKNTFPAVILISGSGPQDRNEELMGHKPFLVLADHLTRNGFAVLRYDDRGTAKSTGDYSTATSADFATDAQAAFDYLLSREDIDTKNIGYAGHSEGGFIAPMVAAKNKNVAFLALLAGVGQEGAEILTEQSYLIAKAQGANEEVLRKSQIVSMKIFDLLKEHSGNRELMQSELKSYLTNALEDNPEMIPQGTTIAQFVDQRVNTFTSPWFQYFILTNPAQFLEKVSCPVLAINGSMDLQVPAKANLSAIDKFVKKGGNTDVTTVEIPNLNHLFQHAETGNPAEYGSIEETFAPEALEIISNWLKEKTK